MWALFRFQHKCGDKSGRLRTKEKNQGSDIVWQQLLILEQTPALFSI